MTDTAVTLNTSRFRDEERIYLNLHVAGHRLGARVDSIAQGMRQADEVCRVLGFPCYLINGKAVRVRPR